MTALPVSFAMNRTCAPQLSLQAFVDLARAVAVSAVEIRNDIPDREFMDGTAAADLLARLQDAGLRVASVNALQRFNAWSREREAEAKSLMNYATRLGAPGVVLCPVHDPDHRWSENESERNLRDGLKKLRPILQDLGIKGYVEPLGMRDSTLKFQRHAVEAVTDIDGWDVYQLCHDTFQFFRCGDNQLFAERIGLAHMSGIARHDLAPEHLTEPDRGLVDNGDRVNNVSQIKALVNAGYNGFVSMEPFNPAVQQSRHLLEDLKASFTHVGNALRAGG